jgi:hypothetical protein
MFNAILLFVQNIKNRTSLSNIKIVKNDRLSNNFCNQQFADHITPLHGKRF